MRRKNIYLPSPEIAMVPLCLTRPPEAKFIIICIFLIIFHSGQWWLVDLKLNHWCLLNLSLYVAEGRTDYHSEWNTCLAYSQRAKSHSSRWCISLEEYINNWRQLKIHVNSQWGKSEVYHIYLLADSCFIQGGKLWHGKLISATL